MDDTLDFENIINDIKENTKKNKPIIIERLKRYGPLNEDSDDLYTTYFVNLILEMVKIYPGLNWHNCFKEIKEQS